MNTTSYLTIKGAATAELVIERSRFIGHCLEVETETDAKSFISEIRTIHTQATHNCYAYSIGNMENLSEHFNDHGEPSGTAGKPILGAIQRLHLINVVVVVTRYFGGKKLGVRGLIDAYGRAATLVLETAGSFLKIPKFAVTLIYDYSQHSTVLHRLQQVEAEILETGYTEIITLRLVIPETNKHIFNQICQDLALKVSNFSN